MDYHPSTLSTHAIGMVQSQLIYQACFHITWSSECVCVIPYILTVNTQRSSRGSEYVGLVGDVMVSQYGHHITTINQNPSMVCTRTFSG
jgi:hypothetical protein